MNEYQGGASPYSSSSRPFIDLLVELLPGGGVVLQNLRRLELGAFRVSEAVHEIDYLLRSFQVQHAEGPAEERREADAKDCANITIGWSTDDLV
jgi:hypothetical protein